MSLYQERSVVNNGIKIVVTGFNHVIILNAPRFYSLDNWPVYWLIILIKFVSTSNSFGSFTSASQLTCLQALEGDVYGCLHASVCLFVCSYTRVTRLLLYHLTSILPQGLTVAQSICHFLRKCLSVCLSVCRFVLPANIPSFTYEKIIWKSLPFIGKYPPNSQTAILKTFSFLIPDKKIVNLALGVILQRDYVQQTRQNTTTRRPQPWLDISSDVSINDLLIWKQICKRKENADWTDVYKRSAT